MIDINSLSLFYRRGLSDTNVGGFASIPQSGCHKIASTGVARSIVEANHLARILSVLEPSGLKHLIRV